MLTTLSEENSDLMFLNTVNKTDEMKCQITITEVVYYDELRVQLTNNKIQFDKNIGSNYVELLMADAIRFLDQNPIQNENNDLENLISELKEADFKQSKKDVIEGMVKDSPFSNTILAVLKLTKNK